MPLLPPFRRDSTRTSSLLMLAVGAAAGVAIGALVAERTGGLSALLGGGRESGRRRPRRDGWRGSARGVGQFEPGEDDEDELAPEAISHMHVRDAEEDYEDGNLVEELEELEERVLEAFRNDPVLRERAIDIGAVDSGTIELTGWVRASSEIGHALTLARGVPGVDAVVDRLAVRGTAMPVNHSTDNYSGLPENAPADEGVEPPVE